MKTQLLQTPVAALTLAIAGYAQRAQPLQVNVPFDFVAGSRTLPAGQYTVLQPVNTSAVVFRSDREGLGVAMITHRLESAGKQGIGKLLFHRHGDRCVLAEVWDTDRSSGRQIPMTAQERELARGAPITRRCQVLALCYG